MATRIRTAATLTANDKFELFNVTYVVLARATYPGGVVEITFQVDEQTNDVHMSTLRVPHTTPIHIL